MRTPSSPDPRTRLLPEGRRWGFGAHSVRPYLARMLQERPGDPAHPGASIRNPVFPHMDQALRALDAGTRN